MKPIACHLESEVGKIDVPLHHDESLKCKSVFYHYVTQVTFADSTGFKSLEIVPADLMPTFIQLVGFLVHEQQFYRHLPHRLLQGKCSYQG